MDNVSLPQENEVKFSGMHSDRGLTCKERITTKIKQFNLKFSKTYWLQGRRSQLTIENKLLLYTATMKRTYGVELWGTASNSNIEIPQQFQAKILRTILNVPWCISNTVIHNYLQMNTVKEVITERARLT
jgi:hypothetical protein